MGSSASHFHWGYSNDNGPHIWGAHFRSALGKHQSPINLCSKETIYDSKLKNSPLHLNYSSNISNATLSNTGHGVQIRCEDETSSIKGGPLAADNVYRLLQFHFHWGSDERWGSEHLVDGQPTAAELHIVHWNSTMFKSPSNATLDNKQNGLCVLGVLLKVGKHNSALDKYISQLEKVDVSGKQYRVENVNIRPLLPDNIENYWTYGGSLTTPPCCECVTWIVFRDVCEISKDQLKSLRQVHKSDCHKENDCIQNNFRPPIPLGDRKLRSTFVVNVSEN